MKKIIKLFIIIILFLCCLNSNIVYATPAKGTDGSGGSGDSKSSPSTSSKTDDDSWSKWKDAFKYADDFADGDIEWNFDDKDLTTEEKKALKESIPSLANVEKDIKKDANSIFNILLAIGTVLTVIVGVVLGIQYMMASAEDKAQVKEKMIPYVVGGVVIYSAFTIWYIVVQVLGNIN